MEYQFDPEFFIEWLIQVNDSAAERQLMKRRPYVTFVGQPHEHQHRPAQLHAKWPRYFLTVMFGIKERRRIGCLRHILAKSMAARFRMAKLPKNKTTSFSRNYWGEVQVSKGSED